MAGRWFRKDADATDHPKILAVTLAARGLWDASIGYCFRQESDGWFPAVALRRIADDPTVDERDLAGQLVAVGLWHEVAGGQIVGGCDHDQCVARAAAAGDGYLVHDYLDWQPSKDERAADRADAAERQRKSRANRTSAPTKQRHTDVTRDSSVSHATVPRDTNDSHTVVTRDNAVSHTPVTRLSQREKRREKRRGEENASGGAAPAAADAGATEPEPPPDPSSDGTAAARPVTAHTLLKEHLDACRKRPPERYVGQLGKEIKRLVDEDLPAADIRAGLQLLRDRARPASALVALVNEVRNPPEPRPRASPPATAADRHAATRAQTRADLAAWANRAQGGAPEP